MKVKQSVCLLSGYVVVLGLAAAMASACLGQDFTPPPGPPGPGFSIPPNQQPGPGFAIPPNQQPDPGAPVPVPGPGFSIPPNQQPNFGPPVPQPRPFVPPNADGQAGKPDVPAAGSDQPPVTAGAGHNSQENGNGGEFGDMMGFGGREGMGGFGGGMNPVDSVRYAVIWFPNVPVEGQATDFEMVGEDLSFTHPLWKDSLNALSLSGGVRNQLFETDAILPDTGQAVALGTLGRQPWPALQPATGRRLDHGRRREHRIGERPPLRRASAR